MLERLFHVQAAGASVRVEMLAGVTTFVTMAYIIFVQPTVLSAAGMAVEDIDLLALHQANIRIIDSAVADLGIAPEKVFNNLQRYGNTSAGSIPLVLDEAAAAGRIERGSKVMISGFGAGLAWGTALLRW